MDITAISSPRKAKCQSKSDEWHAKSALLNPCAEKTIDQIVHGARISSPSLHMVCASKYVKTMFSRWQKSQLEDVQNMSRSAFLFVPQAAVVISSHH